MGLVAARRAGPAQAVTSVCATRSASNMEPARTGSASVTRAGTESTAPSVSTSVDLCVCARGSVCVFDVCLRVNTWVCTENTGTQSPRLNWQLLSTLLKEFGNEKWRQKERPWGI